MALDRMMRLLPAEMRQGLALLAVGGAGAWSAQRIGIPAGVIVGSLLVSGLYRLAGGDPGPWRARYGQVGRLLLGAVVGAAFGPDVLAPLRTALLPMCAVIVVMIGVGLGLGLALARFTPLDASTALISAVPGGLPAMVAIADASDAEATVVTAIHFSRLTTVLVVLPALISLLAGASTGHAAASLLAAPVGFERTAVTVAVGLAGGLLALRARIPTGDLIGSILAVAGVNLLWLGPGPLAAGYRTAAMLLIGIAVGTQVSRESLRLLRRVALPACALIVVLMSTALVLGWGLAQVTSLDLVSALLSSVPGGASTMPLVAHDLGGDMRLVAALHLMRQLVIFVLLPPLLGFLFRSNRRRRVSALEL